MEIQMEEKKKKVRVSCRIKEKGLSGRGGRKCMNLLHGGV